MASEPLPAEHADLACGAVLFDETLMNIDDDGTRWTGTIIGHVDLTGARAALAAAHIDAHPMAVRHTWVQVNHHREDCDLDQQELQDTLAEFLDPGEPDGPLRLQPADLSQFLADARDSVCSCGYMARDGRGVDWWLRPATARDLHAIPITMLAEQPSVL